MEYGDFKISSLLACLCSAVYGNTAGKSRQEDKRDTRNSCPIGHRAAYLLVYFLLLIFTA